MKFDKILKDRDDFAPLLRAIYNGYPYLKNLNSETLEVRTKDLYKNLLYLHNILPQKYNAPHGFSLWTLIKKIEDARTEYENRSMLFPHNYDEILNCSRKCNTLLYNNNFFDLINSNNHSIIPRIVFRFTERKYAEEFLQGKFRLTNSNKYKFLENKAQHDCETEKTIYRLGSHTTVMHLKTNKKINVIGDIEYSNKAPNYFLLSLTSDFDLGLAKEFKADSVIIIKDFFQFMDILENEIGNSFTLHAQLCTYYDFYHEYRREIDPIFSKDISYAYQREIRICAISKNKNESSEYINISLRSVDKLVDICRIEFNKDIVSFY